MLFDSGCGDTIINKDVIRDLATTKTTTSNWTTKTGSFSTNRKCTLTFMLSAFHKHRDVTWAAHVDDTPSVNSRYDMIVGRDLMSTLGLDISFKEMSMTWDNAEVAMQEPDWLDTTHVESFEQELFMMHDPATTDAERIQSILDLKYCKANLEEVVNDLSDLDKRQKQHLKRVLEKFEPLFDGTLGLWNCKPIELELKDPKCKPVHARPYPVPQSQEKKLQEEAARSVCNKVLRKVNDSEWAFPAFTIKKPDGSLPAV